MIRPTLHQTGYLAVFDQSNDVLNRPEPIFRPWCPGLAAHGGDRRDDVTAASR